MRGWAAARFGLAPIFRLRRCHDFPWRSRQHNLRQPRRFAGRTRHQEPWPGGGAERAGSEPSPYGASPAAFPRLAPHPTVRAVPHHAAPPQAGTMRRGGFRREPALNPGARGPASIATRAHPRFLSIARAGRCQAPRTRVNCPARPPAPPQHPAKARRITAEKLRTAPSDTNDTPALQRAVGFSSRRALRPSVGGAGLLRLSACGHDAHAALWIAPHTF